jgi:hypothetical protein
MALRLFSFRRKGSCWRPRAALLAYLLIVAAASAPIRMLLGVGGEVTLSQLALNSVLCLALFAVEGNVTELFRRSGSDESAIARMLRWESWL